MQTTEIIIFGDDQNSVRDVAADIKDICVRKGVEFKGPTPLPVLDLENKDGDLGDEGVGLFGESPSKREIGQLKNKTIFSRIIELQRYSSDDVAKSIAKQGYPDDVFLHIQVTETSFHDADRGNAPFSYDPNHEYNSEL